MTTWRTEVELLAKNLWIAAELFQHNVENAKRIDIRTPEIKQNKFVDAIASATERLVVGEVEVRPSEGPKRNGIEQGLRRARNKLRSEQRALLRGEGDE